MKTSAIACAVLAGVFGFSSLASARDGRGDDRGHDRQQRFEQRHDRQHRFEQRHDRHRFEQRHDRQQRFEQRHDHRAERGGDRRGEAQRHFRADDHGPRHVYRQPSYTYSQPTYRVQSHRFHRGGYLPGHYRSQAYYVNDWHAHPGLYAPPYGQQWVNVNGEFLLVALATGLIVNALLN